MVHTSRPSLLKRLVKLAWRSRICCRYLDICRECRRRRVRNRDQAWAVRGADPWVQQHAWFERAGRAGEQLAEANAAGGVLMAASST